MGGMAQGSGTEPGKRGGLSGMGLVICGYWTAGVGIGFAGPMGMGQVCGVGSAAVFVCWRRGGERIGLGEK